MRIAVASLLIASVAFAQGAPEDTVAPEPTITRGEVMASELKLDVVSAARMGDSEGVLVSATAHNPGDVDLLVLLSEAHVVPPDSMEAACAPASPRFPTTPVLQITRSGEPGAEACAGSQRVPKADWMLSVMRLPAGKSATLVLQVEERARWQGDLFAHLAVSYTTVDRAEAKELKRTEKIGLGMMIAGLEPGGRVVPIGEGGPAVQRAVELFDRRAVAPPVLID